MEGSTVFHVKLLFWAFEPIKFLYFWYVLSWDSQKFCLYDSPLYDMLIQHKCGTNFSIWKSKTEQTGCLHVVLGTSCKFPGLFRSSCI